MSTALREALLEAATCHFGQRGYDGAHVAAIARDAGATKAALYYHFVDKDALWQESVARARDALEAYVAEGPQPIGPRRWLARRLDALCEWSAGHPASCRLLARAGWDAVDDPGDGWAAFGGRFGDQPLLRMAVRGLALELMRTIAAGRSVPSGAGRALAGLLAAPAGPEAGPRIG